MSQNVLQHLAAGVTVRITCDGTVISTTQKTKEGRPFKIVCKRSIVDEGMIRYVGSLPQPRIKIQVFSGHSKGNFEFVFIRSDDLAQRGWRMLLKDSNGGKDPCFRINSPTYRFEVIET